MSPVHVLYDSSFFFFSCSAHYRYLHSFPTRRSSDLRVRITSGRFKNGSRQPTLGRRRSPKSFLPTPPSTSAVAISRSEEQTSELQSRQYLVCRLLLEKNKQTAYSLRGRHASGQSACR